jgi:hypothetical protein
MRLRPAHPARHKPDPAMVFAQYLDQQAGLAPGARVQDEGGFGGDAEHGRIMAEARWASEWLLKPGMRALPG